MAMKIRMLIGWVGLALCAGMAGADEPAPLPVAVPAIVDAPRIDGVLGDGCWRDAAHIGRMFLMGGDDVTESAETDAYLCRDDAWLYLGVDCRNPHMRHVEQKVFNHDDDMAQDESVEFFLFVDPQDPWQGYQLGINAFAGALHDRRHPGPDIAWRPPWRAAARVHAGGWTAEAAIPLYAVADQGLDQARFNIIRNLRRVQEDAYGAKMMERIERYSAAPGVRKNFETPKFIPIANWHGLRPAVPFAPVIQSARVAGYRDTPEGLQYAVALAVAPATEMTGSVNACAIDEGENRPLVESVSALTLVGATNLTLLLPIGDFGGRRVRVELRAAANDEVLACQSISDTRLLEGMSRVIADRSYYTDEEHVVLKFRSALPAEMLQTMRAVAELDGQTLLEHDDLAQTNILRLPLAALRMGGNHITVRLLRDANEFARQVVPVTRLTPRPGFEVKADNFKRILLRNGRPFFPFGAYFSFLYLKMDTGDPAEFCRLARAAGFNMAAIECTLLERDVSYIRAWLDAARSHDLAVIPWEHIHPRHLKAAAGTNVMQKSDYLRLAAPRIRESVALFKQYPNYLAYYNVDELNLRDRDDRIMLAGWIHETVKEADPYHPLFLLYARDLPHGDQWTQYGEMVGFDVYTYCDWDNRGNDPGHAMAYHATRLEGRLARDVKVNLMVPSAGQLDGVRDPVPLSGREQICQAYVAVICGARGLCYFAWRSFGSAENWQAMRTLAKQLDEMAPAILNDPVPHTMVLTDMNAGAAPAGNRNIPGVKARLFRYPDGRYLLMAANLERYSVDVRISIPGLKAAEQLFVEDGAVQLLDGAVMAKLEPNGVRAWRCDLDAGAQPLAVTVAAGRDAGGAVYALFPMKQIIAQVKRGRNHVANPVFEQYKVPGVPAFCKLDGLLPYYTTDHPLFTLDAAMPWEGKPSMRLRTGLFPGGSTQVIGLRVTCYPPADAGRMVFSFYAKAADEGARLRVFAGNRNQDIPIASGAWRRYNVTGVAWRGAPDLQGARQVRLIPLRAEDAPDNVETTIWVSGLQLEAGNTPTEFVDDSAGIWTPPSAF